MLAVYVVVQSAKVVSFGLVVPFPRLWDQTLLAAGRLYFELLHLSLSLRGQEEEPSASSTLNSCICLPR